MSSILLHDYTTIGAECWGDLVPQSASDESEHCSLCDGLCYGFRCSSLEDEALDGWKVPDLRLRKNIWENFPVNVIPISGTNGSRYAVEWNHGKLNSWRTERTESFEEAMEYEAYCESRLLYALRKHTKQYTVEEPDTEEQICVLEMVQREDTDSSSMCESVATACSVTSDGVPIMRTPYDISKHFPVTWMKEGNLVRLEIHRTRLRALDVPESEMRDRILEAVNASGSWTVRKAPKPFLCELVLPPKSEKAEKTENTDNTEPIKKVVLNTISDIRRNFPVTWNQTGNVFVFQFHEKNLRISGKNANVVREAFLESIRESSSWTVRETPAPFLCEITLT